MAGEGGRRKRGLFNLQGPPFLGFDFCKAPVRKEPRDLMLLSISVLLYWFYVGSVKLYHTCCYLIEYRCRKLVQLKGQIIFVPHFFAS